MSAWDQRAAAIKNFRSYYFLLSLVTSPPFNGWRRTKPFHQRRVVRNWVVPRPFPMLWGWRHAVSNNVFLLPLRIWKSTKPHQLMLLCFVCRLDYLVALIYLHTVSPYAKAMELARNDICLVCCLIGTPYLCCNRGRVRHRYSIKVVVWCGEPNGTLAILVTAFL